MINLPGIVFQFYATNEGKWGLNFLSEQTEKYYELSATPIDHVFHDFVSRIHSDDRNDFLESIRDAIKFFSQWKSEFRYIKSPGEILWLRGMSSPSMQEDCIIFDGIMLDITEQKNVELSRKFSDEKFAIAFNSCPEAINITSREDGKYLEVNDAFLRKSGYTRDEVIGHTANDINIWVDQEERNRYFEELMTSGRVHNFETSLRMRNGEIRNVILSTETIDLKGRRCSLNYTVDITELEKSKSEKKRLEEQLFQSQKMESIGRLAGGIAHDFNNLLTAITGNTELVLMSKNITEKNRAHLNVVQQSAMSAAELTRHLLTFSHKQIIEKKIIDLNEVIDNMGKILERIIGENITFRSRLQADLKNIHAEPVQLQQIIMNLSVNSRDAMPSGGILTIETANIYLDENFCRNYNDLSAGNYVLLSVTDTGIGMTDEIREHLFEPFFSTKEIGKGTGLGLATVYGAVKQNDGAIYVSSEPGNGTSFRIYLPTAEGEKSQLNKEVNNDTPPHGNETILVVEDDPGVRGFISSALKQFGYNVLEASNGEEALILSRAYNNTINLVITDIVMTGINGQQLAEIIKQERPDSSLLFASGYTNDLIKTDQSEEEINFLSKPFSARDLSCKIREILGNHL